MKAPKTHCPICNKKQTASHRYPKYVCKECIKRAQSGNGRSVYFTHKYFYGGLIGFYADTKEEYESDECFIDSIKCYAEVARFGGIVIQTERNNDIRLKI